MHVELLDTGGFVLEFPPPENWQPASTIQADDLDRWFWEWARDREDRGAFRSEGLFLIHANGRFTRRAHHQDLQGVELLKHIRLTRWLGPVRAWHAIVYSFEPLTSILSRKPGDLILTSPGVTFLRLPNALSLRDALVRAYPKEAWASLSLQEMLTSLPKASPQDRGFRRYIACDYTPPDSAHSISNWWGIYEMFLADSKVAFPEYADPSPLPEGIRDFVLRLETKKAEFLEDSQRSSPSEHEQGRLQESLGTARLALTKTSARKAIVYVDDEASNGWSELLRKNLNNKVTTASTLHIIDTSSLDLRTPDDDDDRAAYEARINEIAATINEQRPQLLILDLRLCGNSEANQPPNHASGMDLARAVRTTNRYLPILLFTASNKAETLMVSGSLDIDSYWMKPGLGEHGGWRSREEDLVDLIEKLTVLLGDDYAWLRRVSDAVERIRMATGSHWWEQARTWSGPVDNSGQSDVQQLSPERHGAVLDYLDSIMYTVRMILRMQASPATRLQTTDSLESSVPIIPESLPGRLCAALFNQIGQVVELVHDISEVLTNDERGANARIGGYKPKQNPYVYRRCDWWGFYLMAWRNTFSHPGSVATLQQVKRAVSDLIAWLTVAPPEIQSVAPEIRMKIAKKMSKRGRFGHRWYYPLMCLSETEPLDQVTVWRGPKIPPALISCDGPRQFHAQDDRFREQLTMRPEFEALTAKSLEIMV